MRVITFILIIVVTNSSFKRNSPLYKIRRDMKIKKLLSCATIILLIIIIFIIGSIIPKLFISDGIENFEGEEKEFAKYSYLMATQYETNPMFRLIKMKTKVIDVKKISDEKCLIYTEDNPDGFYLNSQYVAKTRTYTLFCIPLELLIGELGDFEIYCMEHYMKEQ